MSLSFTLLTLFTLITGPVQTSFQLGLGETLDVQQLPQDAGLRSFVTTLDANVLATHTYTVNEEGNQTTYTFTYTNEVTLTQPLVGNKLMIASVHPVHEGWIELYNPSTQIMAMADYAIVVNDNTFPFDDGLTVQPFSSLVIPLVFGAQKMGSTIGPIHPLVFIRGIDRLWLIDNIPSPTLLETVEVDTTMITSYGEIAIEDAWFQKFPSKVTPDFTFESMHWRAIPITSTFMPFQIASPTITPLTQAKAWATYVMYGAGMFAAGRVEEAFRALEAEYGWMSAEAKALIFSAPNTIITGINENNEQDRSTFREAVGRYNYLAARVPGAVGLTMPPETTFPWLTIGYASLALMGFVSFFLFIKKKTSRR
jgi:hypothetical protein